jgi:N-acetylmuramate 1-kinase
MEQVQAIIQKKFDTISKIELITPEASLRIYYRIYLKDSTLIFAYDSSLENENHPFLEVQSFFKKNQIPVPEIIETDYINHYSIQKDIGSNDLSTISDDIEYEKFLLKSIDTILKIQSLTPIELIDKKSFDFNKLNFEINHTYRGIESYNKKFQTKIEIDNKVKWFFENNINFLSNYSPKVICHRDYHSRNIMISNKNNITLIDFQDAMMGTPQYDLVSLLYDAYRPIGNKLREKMYDYFKDLSTHKNFKFRETYLNQAMQRSFKALGTYLVMVSERNLEKFYPSIHPCIDNLIEITELGKFPDALYLFFQDLKNQIKYN